MKQAKQTFWLVFLGLLFCVQAWGQTSPVKEDGVVYYYYEGEGGYVVGDSNKGSGYDSSSSLTTLEIKSSINGYPVTAIFSYAFDAMTNKDILNVTSIKIPNTVKKIGRTAFQGCRLTSITIPRSVETIGVNVFWNCDKLKSVYVYSYIPADLLSGDDALSYYQLFAFGNADESKKAILHTPDGSSYTYRNSWKIGTDSGITLYGISGNGWVTIDGVQYTYYSNAGDNFAVASSVDYDREVAVVRNTIPASASGNNTGMEIPVVAIGQWYSSSVKVAIIPEGLEMINENAFNACSSLQSVIVSGATPTLLGGSNVFPEGCTVYIAGDDDAVNTYKEKWTTYTDKIQKYEPVKTIDGVKYTYADAQFTVTGYDEATAPADEEDNTKKAVTVLTEVEGLPVTAIGASAFADCSSLARVVIKSKTVLTLGDNAFGGSDTYFIYVPAGSIDAYTSEWSAYASRIQASVAEQWIEEAPNAVEYTDYDIKETNVTVHTAKGLAWVAKKVIDDAKWSDDKTITLSKSIEDEDFSQKQWTPIGESSSNPFNGTFDGGNQTISGLRVGEEGSTSDYQGLFGYIDRGTVKNVHLKDAVVYGNNYVGGIAGYAAKEFHISGSLVESAIVKGSSNVGVIVGEAENESNLDQNYYTSDVVASTEKSGDMDGGKGGIGTTQYGSSFKDVTDSDGAVLKDDTNWKFHYNESFYNQLSWSTSLTIDKTDAAAKLAAVAKYVNAGNSLAGVTIKIEATEIDLSENGYKWTPIGWSTSRPFAGTFEGNDVTISGLTVTTDNGSYLGLFGVVSGSVSGVHIAKENISGGSYIGGIAGMANANASITDCYVESAVLSHGTSGANYMGAIVGVNNGTLARNYYGNTSNVMLMPSLKTEYTKYGSGGGIGVSNGASNYQDITENDGAVMKKIAVTDSDISGKVTLTETSYTYDGTAKQPEVAIEGYIADTDFSVSYRDADGNVVDEPMNAGTYTVAVSFTGKYTGEIVTDATFTITAASKTDEESGCKYDDYGDEIVLTTLATVDAGSPTTITIPTAIDGKTVVGLDNNLFAAVDASNLQYIDASSVKVEDVSRSSGLFNGIPSTTLIFVAAESSTAATEPNVVIGDVCAKFQLTGREDAASFQTPKDFTATSATLNREFKSSVTSTVCLPFSVSATGFGTFNTFKDIENGNAVFEPITGSTTEPNTPYIFVPGNDLSEVTATNVTVKAGTLAAGDDVEFRGTYTKVSWDADQDDLFCFAGQNEGESITAGQFVRIGAGAYVSPFRAYLRYVPAAHSGAGAPAMLRAVIGGATTGISELKNHEESGEQWFTLSGRQLSGKPVFKGLYIHNGRKEVVK